MRTLANAGLTLALLLPALPAHADAAPTQADAWAFVDTTHADIARFQQPGGPARSLSSPDPYRQISGLTVSQDGLRFGYVDNASDACCATDRVVVKTSDARPVRIFDDGGYAFSGFNYVTQPHLSPHATRVVWTRLNKGDTHRIEVWDLTNGKYRDLPGTHNLTAQAWLTTRWLLATSPDGVVTTSANGGGSQQTVAGLTTKDSQFAVSPDGTQLVWSRRTSADLADTEVSDLYRADLTVSDAGVATLSGITQLVTGQDNVSPTWSRDGQRIVFVRATGVGGGGSSKPGFYNPIGNGKRGVVPASGGSPAFYVSSLSVSQVVNVGKAYKPL